MVKFRYFISLTITKNDRSKSVQGFWWSNDCQQVEITVVSLTRKTPWKWTVHSRIRYFQILPEWRWQALLSGAGKEPQVACFSKRNQETYVREDATTASRTNRHSSENMRNERLYFGIQFQTIDLGQCNGQIESEPCFRSSHFHWM